MNTAQSPPHVRELFSALATPVELLEAIVLYGNLPPLQREALCDLADVDPEARKWMAEFADLSPKEREALTEQVRQRFPSLATRPTDRPEVD